MRENNTESPERSAPVFFNLPFMRTERGVFVNLLEADIMKALKNEPFINQHILSETSGYSIGAVNEQIAAQPDN